MVTHVAGCGRSLLRITALAGILALSACASLTSGTEQTITVVTAPVTNASCTLRNAHGSWQVPRTPGTVTIRRAYGELTVACAAADGGSSGEATAASTVAPATFGNILLMGSVVWAAVDAASGAAFAYPDQLSVPLKVAVVAEPAAAVAAAAKAAPDDPQVRIAQLRQLREEHRISAVEFQLRLAEIAAATARPSVAVAPPTAAQVAAAAAAADDPKSRLLQLRQLRAEHRISAMEYQLRLADLVERGGLPADALK
jgi:hypothetical protein